MKLGGFKNIDYFLCYLMLSIVFINTCTLKIMGRDLFDRKTRVMYESPVQIIMRVNILNFAEAMGSMKHHFARLFCFYNFTCYEIYCAFPIISRKGII